MFEREAMWISINDKQYQRPAVKVSVGGVNAITGVASASPTPPQFTQDYVVAGLQPWLDGVMTDSGIVRQFVAMSHGSGYTVEEQITSKAEQGGLQFDVFPVHDMTFVASRKGGGVLNQQSTAAELSLATGDEVQLTISPVSSHAPLSDASLSKYLDKAICSVILIASYVHPISDAFISWNTQAPESLFLPAQSQPAFRPKSAPNARQPQCPPSAFQAPGPFNPLRSHTHERTVQPSPQLAPPSGLGVAPGGRIMQRIYRDIRSTRVYDEERGQRFHIHIVNPTEWELITGIVAPIKPISTSSYKHTNLPWFVLADSHKTTLSLAGSSLSQIKSVAELDAEKEAECAGEIDPDHPPSCSKHPRTASVCVFRPCSHTACSTCLGAVMMLRMKCLACETKVDRIVGMKDAVVVPSQVEGADGLEWDVSQMEELATLAADSKNVSIIHLEEDRVSPLYRSGSPNGTLFRRSRPLPLRTLPPPVEP
ncbi:hypothetical protein HYDPIDRAFT_44622 [Hydnomerulius pinastri MD-312]|uniref:RING-type domain-containing protein n=1 Tax=Hydnomerulius pinastri MD-312 TaxID=994086 RepID=A0A0C9VXS1_9AGAM|nr:hypothetical protein HYDPIDRAFT_44622 [Hydnomerulius pinastri MD-312]